MRDFPFSERLYSTFGGICGYSLRWIRPSASSSLSVLLSCTLKEYHEVGNHYLYICDVYQVLADEDEEALFAWNGYGKIAMAKQGEYKPKN